MRKIARNFALLGTVFFASCEKETLDPRTNPRFSVTVVQEISSSGVQFGADIYDFGGEEILEYGFVYTQSSGAPDLIQDDYVSNQGRPEPQFELVANHSMTLGKKYYVSAFMRTNTSLIFSKSVEFISQGSEGFIINSIEWPGVIYKDQKLVVKGQRFSKQPANYKIKLGQFDVYPDLIDSNTFTINLPLGLLTETTGQNIETELLIEINEKSYAERRVLKFQEPVFESQAVQKIDLGEDVIIKGDFLDLGQGRLITQGQLYRNFEISKTQLKFKPYTEFGFPKDGEPTPMVYFEIRGQRYEVGRIFEINPTQLDSTPIIFDKEKNYITGKNFNRNELTANRFVDQYGVELDWPYEIISSDSLAVFPRGFTFSAREFSVRVKNYGKFSNPVNIRLDFPEIRLSSSGRVPESRNIGTSTVVNGKGYSLTSAGIIEENLEFGFSNKIIAPLPAQWFDFSYQIKIFKSGLFIYGGGVDQQQNPNKKLYSFSIQSGKWEELTDLPNGNFSFTRIHEVSDGIIFEQGYKPGDAFFIEGNQEKWHFSIQNRTWKRLTDTEIQEGQTILTFNYKGSSYAFGINTSNTVKELQRYDESLARWIGLAPAPTIWRSAFENPLILNGKIYVFQSFSENVEFDLEKFTFKSTGYSDGMEGYSAFVKGQSIYIIPGNGNVYDFRPSLLK